MQKLVCFIFILISCVKATSQQPVDRYNFNFKTYTTKDGLPDNVILKTVKDKYGFLWIATHNGISRFDGLHFKNYTYNPEDSTGLRSIWTTDLFIDNYQTLWATTEWGVCYYNANADRFVYINNRADIQPIFKAPMCSDSSGFVWVAAENGLKKIDPVSKKFFGTALKNIPDPQFIVNTVGSIFYIGTRGKGLYKYDSKINSYTKVVVSILPTETHYMGALKDGNITWMATGEGLLMLDKNEKFSLYFSGKTVNKADQLMCIKSYNVDGNNRQLICGTYNKKLFLFDKIKKEFTTQFQPTTNQPNGYSPALVYNLFKENNNYWISTDRGLTLFNTNEEKQTFLIESLTKNNNTALVKKVLPFNNGATNLMWFYAWQPINSIVLFNVDNKKIVQQWPANFNGKEAKYYDIILSKNNNKLIALRDNAIDFYSFKNGLELTIPYKGFGSCIYEDEIGNLWIGTFDELIYIDINTRKAESYSCNFEGTEVEKNTFGGKFFISAIKKYGNNIWISSGKYGLFSFNLLSKKFTPHRQKFTDTYSGLNRCSSLQITNADSIWVGNTAGLSCYIPSQNKFINYNANNNLKSNYVYAIEKDKYNNIVGRGNVDVFYLNTHTNKILSIKLNPQFSVFDYEQKLYSKGNEIYLSHEGGFTKYNVDNFTKSDSINPFILITNFKVANKEIFFNKDSTSIENILLQNNQNQITISYTAIEFNKPEEIEYWYFLEGLDKDWVNAAEKDAITYSNLKPGKYSFKVYAVNKFYNTKSATASLNFCIAPAFWQRFWFWPLLALVFIVIVIFVARRRVAGIRKKEKQKTAINKTMAELETKMLRSQMNPHFIFNSLNSIQKYIWENKEEDAAEYLATFAKLMRAILENSRKETVPLEEEVRVMKLYVELEHRRSNAYFDYYIKVDENLIIQNFTIPPLLLQPFIENAIWHGLNKKKSKGNLTISIKKDADKMVCIIDDDGIGRQAKSSVGTETEKKSLGINITQQRIERLMETTGQYANVTIIDKTDNEIALGTTVTITLPLQTI